MSITKTNLFSTKIVKILILSVLSFAIILGFVQYFNNIKADKNAAAAGTNNANLIIGKVDTGSAIEVSACLQNTGDSIRLTDSSLWLGFDNTQLTPSSTILQTGIFSGGNGYSALQFKQVLPAPVAGQTSEKWTVATVFPGLGTSPETGGNPIPNTPELVAKVKFDKIGNPTSPAINVIKSQYFTVEYGAVGPITLNIINQTTNCLNSNTTVISSSSSSSNSSSNSSSDLCNSKLSVLTTEIAQCNLKKMVDFTDSITCNKSSININDTIDCQINLQPGNKYYLTDTQLIGGGYSVIDFAKYIPAQNSTTQFTVDDSINLANCVFSNDSKLLCSNINSSTLTKTGEFEFGYRYNGPSTPLSSNLSTRDTKNFKVQVNRTNGGGSGGNGGVITIYSTKNCPAGQYAKNGNCTDCPANSFCPGGLVNGSDAPSTICPTVKSSPVKSQKLTDCVDTNITKCTAGSTLYENKCYLCSSPLYLVNGVCGTTCQDGYEEVVGKSFEGNKVCRLTNNANCKEGYYCSDANSSKICETGYYCPTGSTSPIACPSGRSTRNTGSRNSSDCVEISIITAERNNNSSGATPRTGGFTVLFGGLLMLGLTSYFVFQNYIEKSKKLGNWKKM
jgi:hypothetical protein